MLSIIILYWDLLKCLLLCRYHWKRGQGVKGGPKTGWREGYFTDYSFSGVLIVMFFFRDICRRALFALYFLWMGSHPCLFDWHGFSSKYAFCDCDWTVWYVIMILLLVICTPLPIVNTFNNNLKVKFCTPSTLVS
jgi:hypothetical protein